jgi:hypothetical protein
MTGRILYVLGRRKIRVASGRIYKRNTKISYKERQVKLSITRKFIKADFVCSIHIIIEIKVTSTCRILEP